MSTEGQEVSQPTEITQEQQSQQAAELEQSASPEDSTAEDQGEEGKPEEKLLTQEQVNEIVQREKAKAEAKAARRAERTYRETLERLGTQQAVQQQVADKPPARDAYASDEAWLDARDAYRDAKRDQQQAVARQQQEASSMAAKTEKFYAEAEKIAGFDRDDFDELPLTPHIAAALVDSDIAPKLMHYLATNPGEVERMAALSPARQAAEMGKIEAKIATAPVKQSKAPAPIEPIGSGKGTASTKDISKLGMDEYLELRKKQGASWAR